MSLAALQRKTHARPVSTPRSIDAAHATDESLVDALGAADRPTRDTAQSALASRLESHPALAERIGALLARRDRDTRRRACALLASIHTSVAVDALARAVSDRDPDVRAGAARALGTQRAKDPRAWVALVGGAADPDPRVQIAALAALAVISPAPSVMRPLGFALVTDRYSIARGAHDVLAGAGDDTLDAARSLLDDRDPLVQRAGLAVMHATGAWLDRMSDRVMRLVQPGVDPFVRRASARVLGRVKSPTRELVERLGDLGRDWDPALRVIASVSLGQLASRDSALASRSFLHATRRIPHEELAELAAALRAAGKPTPPSAPLLARLATTRGYAQLDLADALLEPHGDLGLPLAPGRVDDAIESVAEHDRTRIASVFLGHSGHASAAVRASCAVFAAHLDASLATAITLQRLADSDDSSEVRSVAKSLLERVVNAARE
jgi:HEAT repeat protein